MATRFPRCSSTATSRAPGGRSTTGSRRPPYRAPDDNGWAGLEDEARALRAFLAPRDPAVYRRYARWWAELPGAEVRLIGRGAPTVTPTVPISG